MDKTQLIKLVNRNMPKIMAGVAISGVITTAVLAANGHLQAQQIRYEIAEDRGETIVNAFKARWKCYAPAVVSACITIAAIMAGQKASDKRIAAVSAAYSVTKDSYAAYKKSVAEHVTSEKKLKEIEERTNVIQQADHPVDKTVVIGSGEVLCLDLYTGRYFSSTREEIRRAVNDVNVQILNEDYAPLNAFYATLGLDEVKIGDDLGWNVDNRCDVLFGTSMSEDGKPCLAINFSPDPIPGWWTRG